MKRTQAAQAATAAVIAQFVKTLKVPAIGREYAALVRQARQEGWPYEDFLRDLLEIEVQTRQQRCAARLMREARFPDPKTLDQIDWTALAGVSRPLIEALSTCQYLCDGHDVVIAGPIGTGKTHLAIALGIEAVARRHRTAFIRAADLVRDLLEARNERTLGRLHKRYERTALLIIDELGFVPFDRTGGELLFNLLSERYERRSTIVTTNLAFSQWVQVFGDEKLTTALLDRLGHHAHIITTRGTSYRTRKRSLPTTPSVTPPPMGGGVTDEA
jgi:DNA replication protein DnaC